MYVSAIFVCLLRGRSTPAIRAIVSLVLPAVRCYSFQLRGASHEQSFLARGSKLEAALSLTLLMFRVLADHPHHTLAVDDLALVTNFLYRCSYFHNCPAPGC